MGLATLSDTLRGYAWRDHCAAPSPISCVDDAHNCCQPGHCRADALFPVNIGGGAPSWRMATLFVQWYPTPAQLQLIALGTPACKSIGWATRILSERHQLHGATPLAVATLADVELVNATGWQLTFVTPWLVSKSLAQDAAPPTTITIAHELRKAIRLRAHKITALCCDNEQTQRLAVHLAHHVADALLLEGLCVEQAAVEPVPLMLGSRGNGASFTALTWSGTAVVRVKPEVLPWLSLLAICGGGENADKGFGGVELTPLD